MDIQDIRSDFPILQQEMEGEPLVYLDNAATSQTPEQVVEEVQQVYRETYSNPGRSMHRLGHNASQLVEEARETTADFVGAGSEEIVFTQNATDSLNQAAQSLCTGDLTGKTIVVAETEHHSNYLPWKKAAARTGATLRTVKPDRNGRIDPATVEATLDDTTHVFAYSHTCNLTVTVQDARNILDAAGAADHTVIDICQTVPHTSIDLHGLGADIAAFSPHKMLAPAGLGVLYGRKQLLDEVEPARFGGGMVTDTATDTYRDSPHRHEAGTVNLEAIAGLARAIDYLKDIGMDSIEDHEAELAHTAYERLKGFEGIHILGGNPDSGILSFTHEHVHSHDIASFLNSQGIAVRAGDHCSQPLLEHLGTDDAVRISPYLYNTEKEIHKTVDAIEQALEEITGVR